MPKPLLLNRRSGLYVRFRVPTDLRDAVGSRFLVRPLRHPPGETARLAAAVLDVALSNAFRKIRTGGVMVDIKQLLKDAEDAFQLTIGGVRLPNGVELTNVLINTAEDERQFRDLMAAATPTSTSQGAKTAVAVERRKEDLLSALSATHLADLERAGRDKKTVLESRHSLMLLRGVLGDIPAADLTSDHCRQFFDDVAYCILASVTQPDGSAWSYNLADLAYDVKSTPPNGHCLDPKAPDETLLKVGTITGPSGISGRFELRPTRHGRSDVYEMCDAPSASSNGTEHAPRYSNNLALRAKSFSDAGIGTLAWSYSYPVATASWRKDCQTSGCVMTAYSEMVDPSGNTTRFTFSNRADATEGKPLKTEYFSGGTAGAPVRTETFAYASPTQGPWPTSYGGGFNIYANTVRQESEIPMLRKDTAQDGDTYTWQALTFDGYARAATTRRSSSFGYSVEEGHA